MSSGESLHAELSTKMPPFGLRLWVVIGISVCMLIVFILCFLCIWATFRKKKTRAYDTFPISQIPDVSKEIAVDRVGSNGLNRNVLENQGHLLTLQDKYSDKHSGKMLAHLARSKSSDADNLSQCSSVYHIDRAGSSHSGDEGGSGPARSHPIVSASPLVGLPEFSHLGWGHWFTLRDLENATNRFSKENVIGEGGYGVVYRGKLINGTEVAVKKLLNNL